MIPGDTSFFKPLAWLTGGFALIAIYSLLARRAQEEEADRARGWRVQRFHGHAPDYEEFDGRRWHRVRFKIVSTGDGPHTATLVPTPSWSEMAGTIKATRQEIFDRLKIPDHQRPR
jgi:hypothetical protein